MHLRSPLGKKPQEELTCGLTFTTTNTHLLTPLHCPPRPSLYQIAFLIICFQQQSRPDISQLIFHIGPGAWQSGRLSLLIASLSCALWYLALWIMMTGLSTACQLHLHTIHLSSHSSLWPSHTPARTHIFLPLAIYIAPPASIYTAPPASLHLTIYLCNTHLAICLCDHPSSYQLLSHPAMPIFPQQWGLSATHPSTHIHKFSH